MLRRFKGATTHHGRKDRGPTAMTAIALLIGAGFLLSGCTAAPDYDPPDLYAYDYPAHGYLGFDYWDGWPGWRRHWDGDHWDRDHWDHGGRHHG